MNNFYKNFSSEFIETVERINQLNYENLVSLIKNVQKKRSRIFFFGVGGSSANCSHAVNDFRKLLNIECYTPGDNFSEVSARINDDGWDTALLSWLKVSKPTKNDLLYFMSVGGGNYKLKVSVNLIEVAKFAKKKGIKMVSTIGKKNSFLGKNTSSVIFDIKNQKFLTPITEALQVYLWHCLVTDPRLQKNKTKW